MSHENEIRASRGTDALDYYMDQNPDYGSDAYIRSQEALTDLLSDLRHACKDDELDFEAAVQMPLIHFEEE